MVETHCIVDPQGLYHEAYCANHFLENAPVSLLGKNECISALHYHSGPFNWTGKVWVLFAPHF